MVEAVREEQGRLVIGLDGEIDLDRAPKLRNLLLDCVGRGRDVLVDLSQVTYIDSSGIASLVESLQKAAGNGTRFGLIAVSPEVMRVFELARLDKVFAIYPDFDAAKAVVS
ncbi:MAG: STAS domain-containing protein [Kiloniellaceae bacterium]